MGSPASREKAPPRPEGGETADPPGLATVRYSSADKLRASGPSRLVWRPVLALVDLIDWLLAHTGVLATLAVLAAAAHAGWTLLPPYLAHHAFRDEVAEIGRSPTRDDALVRALLGEAIRRRKLDAYVADDAFEVAMTQGRRRIVGRYKVPVALLGRPLELTFRIDLDQWVAVREPGDELR